MIKHKVRAVKEYEKYGIPGQALIESINQIQRRRVCCVDSFTDSDFLELRALVGRTGIRVEHIPPERFRIWGVNLRKRGLLERAAGGHSAKPGRRGRKLKPLPQWYKDYLKTPHWIAFAAKVRAFWGHRCAMNCKHYDAVLEVHHRTYERLWREELTDCLALCQACHQLFHRFCPDPPNESPPSDLFRNTGN